MRVLSVSVTKENAMRYQYGISIKKGKTKEQLLERLKALETVKQLRITINEITSV